MIKSNYDVCGGDIVEGKWNIHRESWNILIKILIKNYVIRYGIHIIAGLCCSGEVKTA